MRTSGEQTRHARRRYNVRTMQRPALFTIALAALLVAAIAGACKNPDSRTEYIVTIAFTDAPTQDNLDHVKIALLVYDKRLDFVVQETFQPTGVAFITTDTADFCAAAVAELRAMSFVRDATCRDSRHITPVSSPDAPVSSES
jgi:hypothetical protein